MGTVMSLIRGLATGAGSMYYFDPRSGRRRRALLRDKADMLAHDLSEVMVKAGRDLAHRAQGLLAGGRALINRGDVPDDVLAARIRAKLGRVVSHVHAIDVGVDNGRISLRGPVLAEEVDGLMDAVYAMPGVSWVDNQLDVHSAPDGVPGLQGQGRRTGPQFARMQQQWAPGPRVLIGALGALLTLRGGRQPTMGRLLLGTVGLGLLIRAITNQPLGAVVGKGTSPAIEVHKSILINAPLSEVYGFLSNPENFPRIMEHARQVRRLEGNRHHWVVSGPANVPVEFATETVALEPDRLIAWQSVAGSAVSQCGKIVVQGENGGTRVNIKMAYEPPAGMVGHAVATLFGKDPKHAFDDDLLRLKSLLEEGKTTAHSQTVSRGEFPR